MMIPVRWIVPLCCLLLISCAGNVGGGQVDYPVVQVDAGQNARNTAGDFESEWISDQERLKTLWRGLGGKFFSGSGPAIPEVDFSQERILFLSMGQQRTAGYTISLASERMAVSEQTGIVRVLWQEPAPGSIQAQVLTAPYLVLRVPKLGVKGIRVLDQDSRLRAEVFSSPPD